jgi:hypothetical protein
MTARGMRYLRSNALGALALFVALGGTGYAATGGFSQGGTLTACVNDEGSLKLLRAGNHCKRGQKAVAWNQTGPQGAKGPPGAPGANGAAGAKGVNGLNGLNGTSADIKWAAINGLGFILASEGVVAIGDAKPGYAVAFDSDITGCAVIATQNGATSNVVSAVDRAGSEAIVHIENFKSEIQFDNISIVAIC